MYKKGYFKNNNLVNHCSLLMKNLKYDGDKQGNEKKNLLHISTLYEKLIAIKEENKYSLQLDFIEKTQKNVDFSQQRKMIWNLK